MVLFRLDPLSRAGLPQAAVEGGEEMKERNGLKPGEQMWLWGTGTFQGETRPFRRRCVGRWDRAGVVET